MSFALTHLNGFNAFDIEDLITLVSDPAANISDANSYTFNSQSLGADDANRVIVVVCLTRVGTNATISATLDGNAMTKQVESHNGINGEDYATIFTKPSASGATGNIVITANGGRRCKIQVFRLINSTETPVATGSAQGASGSSQATLNIAAMTPSGVNIGVNRPAAFCRYSIATTNSPQWGATWHGKTNKSDLSQNFAMSCSFDGSNHIFSPTGLIGIEDFDAQIESTNLAGGENMVGCIW